MCLFHFQKVKVAMEELPGNTLQLNYEMLWKKKSLDQTFHLISLFLFYFLLIVIDKVFQNQMDLMLWNLDQDQPLNLVFQQPCEVKLKYHLTMSIPHGKLELKFNFIYNSIKVSLFIVFYLKYGKLVFYFPFES